MPKYTYRKIKYFTEREAEAECDRLNGEVRRNSMAGVYYDTAPEPEGWIVEKYVLRNLVDCYAKSGRIPCDYEEGYREGYHRLTAPG